MSKISNQNRKRIGFVVFMDDEHKPLDKVKGVTEENADATFAAIMKKYFGRT